MSRFAVLRAADFEADRCASAKEVHSYIYSVGKDVNTGRQISWYPEGGPVGFEIAYICAIYTTWLLA